MIFQIFTIMFQPYKRDDWLTWIIFLRWFNQPVIIQNHLDLWGVLLVPSSWMSWRATGWHVGFVQNAKNLPQNCHWTERLQDFHKKILRDVLMILYFFNLRQLERYDCLRTTRKPSKAQPKEEARGLMSLRKWDHVSQKWLVKLQEKWCYFAWFMFWLCWKTMLCLDSLECFMICLFNYPSRPFNLDGIFVCFNRVLVVRFVETVFSHLVPQSESSVDAI